MKRWIQIAVAALFLLALALEFVGVANAGGETGNGRTSSALVSGGETGNG